MPLMYLPMKIYAALLDAMFSDKVKDKFSDWGRRKHRATIIAHDDEATAPVALLPAPQPRVLGGI